MDNRWIRRARRIDCRGFREAEFPGRHGLRLSDAHAHPPHHARHARRELMVIGPSSLRATLRVQVQTISEVGKKRQTLLEMQDSRAYGSFLQNGL
jgi:hypothetical protein